MKTKGRPKKKKENKLKHLAVYLPDYLLERIKQTSGEKQISISEYIRRILDEYA